MRCYRQPLTHGTHLSEEQSVVTAIHTTSTYKKFCNHAVDHPSTLYIQQITSRAQRTTNGKLKTHRKAGCWLLLLTTAQTYIHTTARTTRTQKLCKTCLLFADDQTKRKVSTKSAHTTCSVRKNGFFTGEKLCPGQYQFLCEVGSHAHVSTVTTERLLSTVAAAACFAVCSCAASPHANERGRATIF